MNDDIAIKIEGLTKVYKIFDRPIDRVKEALHPFHKRYSKDFYALNDVSFEIKKGETVGIIGKNGAGKSTLLKIITGVLTPTSGSVEVNGRIASLLELGAGFNPEMTGIENIYMNGSVMGYGKKEMDEKIDAIIDFADIGDFIHQPVKMYSSGMFARLAFAMNSTLEPDVLIVDEALAVGDMAFQNKCIFRLKTLRQKGITILFVAHDVSMTKALCSRCLYLKAGTVIADGKPDIVCDMYQNDMTEISKKQIVNDECPTMPVSKNEAMEKYFRIDASLPRRITQRSGSNEIEITAFDFYNEGRIITAQKMFTPITIVISGITYADIPAGAAVGIICRDRNGNDVFVGNLNLSNLYLPFMSTGKRFTIKVIYDIPLAPGEYFFGVAVKPHPLSSYFYDRLFNVNNLTIEKRKEFSSYIGGVCFKKISEFDFYMEQGDI